MARRPLTISEFIPQAQITIYCVSGVTYHWADIEPDIVSITLQRSVDGSAGAFGLTFLANTDSNGATWADRISPMDYVEIKMGYSGPAVAASTSGGVGVYTTGTPLKIRFRGFVDNCGYSTVFGSSGGPQRSVTINGRDYTKLFMVSNIQYLWTSSILAAQMAQAGFGLTFNYNLPWQINTVSAFVNGIIDTIFNGNGTPTDASSGGGTGQAFLPAFRESGVGAQVPPIQVACSVPDKYNLVSLAVQPYTGPFINLLTYFQSSPLGEMFVYDNEDGPVLVYRVTPLKDENGYFASPAVDPTPGIDPSTQGLQLGHVLTSTDFSTGKQISKSDNEVLNFFFVYSDVASTDAGSMAAYVAKDIGGEAFSIYSGGNLTSNPYWNSDSTKRFGLRPLTLDSPWVPYLVTGNYQELAIELATFLGTVYGFNEKLYSGDLAMHGDPLFIPGRYLGITDQNTNDLWSFYLESVTDTFNFKPDPTPSWTAQLGVTRGFKTKSFS